MSGVRSQGSGVRSQGRLPGTRPVTPDSRLPRGLDHVVHAVHDLDAAGDLYRRLGFTVGTRNQHPPSWGTHNRIVQLPGFFIELLTVAESAAIAPHARSFFSFGAFNRDFLAHTEGLSMLVVEGRDATADAAVFRSAGIGDFEVFDFEREAARPDGSPVKVGFSLAYASNSGAPDTAFFVCQQHYPENFWHPAFQDHRNTARAVAGVVLVAENPSDHHVFLSAFTGERELLATSSGVSLRTPRGEIQVMDAAAYRNHFGVEPPDVARGARLAAVRLAVQDFGAAISTMQAAGIAASVRMGRLIVAPQVGMGATLVFEVQ
jgi:catechol 2,3-dioxygenase-like lactoylglutathione lyase family enzyme